jgi:hypothetical protein
MLNLPGPACASPTLGTLRGRAGSTTSRSGYSLWLSGEAASTGRELA